MLWTKRRVRFGIPAAALALLSLTTAVRATTDDWIPAGHLDAWSGLHTATRLADGRVLVAGGAASGVGATAAAEIYDPATRAWTAAAPMTTARGGHTATLLPNGRVLVAGGFGATRLASAEIYDPVADSWAPAAPMNAARNDHTATRLASGKILVAGGYGVAGTTGGAEVYDPIAGTWQTVGSLAYPRADHRAVRLADGRVLVCGGFNDGAFFGALSTAEIFSPASGTWSPAASMAAGRYFHSATLLADGRVMVAGGAGPAGSLGSVEIWTPDGSWSPAASFGTSRVYHGAALLTDGRVLVAGGQHDEPPVQTSLALAQIYDPVAGTWTTAPPLATARYWHSTTPLADGSILVVGGNGVASAELFTRLQGSMVAAPPTIDNRNDHTATTLLDGRVLVAGGFDNAVSTDNASAEIYDPVAGTWTATPDMPESRYFHSATRLLDGRVLVAGGLTDVTLGSLTEADLFDPATGTWSSAAPMTQTRDQHPAELLADGRVLVCGGYDEFQAVSLTEAEIYTPGGSWQPTASMAFDRAGDTATRLRDGRILVVGGYPNFGDLLAVTELFDPATGAWTGAGSIDPGRYEHTATLLEDGRVLVAGGIDSDRKAVRSATIYDPATGTWTPTGDLTAPRFGHSATRLLDGRVLVTGGAGNESPYTLRSTEIYDPATGAWSPAANLLLARYSQTGSLLPDGSVLIVGGGMQSFTTERFVPDPGPPSRPHQVVAAPGDGVAAVSWSAPAWNGGSAITSYSIIVAPGGAIATVAGNVTQALVGGLSNGVTYTFTVSATNAQGTSAPSQPSNAVTPQAGGVSGDTASGSVDPQGGTVTTGSTEPTALDPVETSVVVPPTADGGTVTITESAVTQTPPSGYSFAGQEVTIVSTAATTSSNPLMLVFTLDASIVAGQTPQTIQMTRSEGGGPPVIVPDCTGAAGVASPDPCVSFRGYVNAGDIRLVVLASSASVWNFAVPVGCMTPDEVSSLTWASPSAVQWTASAGAAHWNSYRGTIPSGLLGSRVAVGVYDTACLESADQNGDGATATVDAAAPPLGTAYYYLASGESGCGEGPLGRRSSGAIIPNDAPCPTPP